MQRGYCYERLGHRELVHYNGLNIGSRDLDSSVSSIYEIVKFEISSDTINRTTHCHCNFNCLNGNENPTCCDDKPLCSVTSEIGKDMLHVDFNNDYSCSYKLDFVKAGFICNCPVRYEIYKRHDL